MRSAVKDFSTGISTSDYKTLVPYYSATSSYNTQFKSGALTEGFGVKKAVFSCDEAPEFKVENVHPKAIYYYKRFNSKVGLYSDYLLVYGTDSNFYKAIIGESEGFEIVENLSFEKKPFAVNYNYAGEDVIIFSIDGVIKVYNGNVEVVGLYMDGIIAEEWLENAVAETDEHGFVTLNPNI